MTKFYQVEITLPDDNKKIVIKSEPGPDKKGILIDVGDSDPLNHALTKTKRTAWMYEAMLLYLNPRTNVNAANTYWQTHPDDEKNNTFGELIYARMFQQVLEYVYIPSNQIPDNLFDRKRATIFAACLIDASNFKVFEKELFSDVLEAAYNSDIGVVEFMLKNHPRFLLMSGDATEEATGKKLRNTTVLQAACYAGDDQLCEIIKTHCSTLTVDLQGNSIDGLTEMKRQFDVIFPHGYETYLDQQSREAEEVFLPLMPFIREKNIERFQKAFDTYVAKHPAHNPYLLKEAYRIFEDMRPSDEFFHFARSVLGFIQKRHSPRAWQKIYCSGIYHYMQGIKRGPFYKNSFILNNSLSDIRTLSDICFVVDIFGEKNRFPAGYGDLVSYNRELPKQYQFILSHVTKNIQNLLPENLRPRLCAIM